MLGPVLSTNLQMCCFDALLHVMRANSAWQELVAAARFDSGCAPPAPQVIANTGGVLGLGGTPHEVMVRANKSIVDVDKVPFKGPKTPHAKWHKVGMRLTNLCCLLCWVMPRGGGSASRGCALHQQQGALSAAVVVPSAWLLHTAVREVS